MGKEAWHDGGSWSGRGRDDDYGDGKKRKFNDGVLVPIPSPPVFTPHCIPYRLGMTGDKIHITDIKIMV
jgi:hypothetical protein